MFTSFAVLLHFQHYRPCHCKSA